ncbi:hypothetical protein BC830DRAFT_1261458 [Chytriomyces sp. MP71]|nr:hypothetical protein BC830DRAFT_1261458 [Chytriomyces sp. MP71]
MITINGLQVFKKFGLYDEVMRNGQTVNVNSTMCRIDGKQIANFKIPEGDFCCIMRAALHRILNEASARAGVKFICGKRLVQIVQESGKLGVTATFADGSAATGDILIGADGIRSVTRQLTCDPNGKPIYTGIRGVLGVTKLAEGDPWLSKASISFFMDTSKQVSVNVMAVGNNLVSWNVGDHKEEEEEVEDWVPLVNFPQEAQRLATMTSSWGLPPDVVEIIAKASRIQNVTIYDRASIKSWTTGNITLVGDAAHGMPPHLGQGTSMALEDVGVLSELLSRFPDDPHFCFIVYEKIRIARTTKMAEMTRQQGGAQYTKTKMQQLIGEVGIKVFAFLANRLGFKVYAYNYMDEIEKALKDTPRL